MLSERPGHSAPWLPQLPDGAPAAALSTEETQATPGPAAGPVSLAACVALGPGPVEMVKERLAGLAPPLCVPPETLVPT